MSDPLEPWQNERMRRRGAERTRLRRQGWGATIAVLVVLGATGVAAALALDSFGGRNTSTAGRTGREPAAAADSSRPTSTASNNRAAPLAALRGKTIAIDPGHNGGNYLHSAEINRLVNAGTLMKPCDTTGTSTSGGYTEAAYTLDVALRLAAILRQADAHVVLTRTTNNGWGPCITERAAIGNRAHAEAAISIHADGGPSSGRGFFVIYPPSIKGLTDDIAAASKRLALDVRAAFHSGTGMPYATYISREGLDVRSDLGGLNLSDVPKIFIETGNMRNATDASLLASPTFRQREARALARGLATFLGS